jgi:hypothetical protein
MDRPHHDHVGISGRRNSVDSDPDAILLGPLLSRCGRSRILSRTGRLPEPLVPQRRSRQGDSHVHDGDTGVASDRRTAFRAISEVGLAWLERMALAPHPGRLTCGGAGRGHALLLDGSPPRCSLASGGRTGLADGRTRSRKRLSERTFWCCAAFTFSV